VDRVHARRDVRGPRRRRRARAGAGRVAPRAHGACTAERRAGDPRDVRADHGRARHRRGVAGAARDARPARSAVHIGVPAAGGADGAGARGGVTLSRRAASAGARGDGRPDRQRAGERARRGDGDPERRPRRSGERLAALRRRAVGRQPRPVLLPARRRPAAAPGAPARGRTRFPVRRLPRPVVPRRRQPRRARAGELCARRRDAAHRRRAAEARTPFARCARGGGRPRPDRGRRTPFARAPATRAREGGDA
jgi:hypothetical protein